LKDTQCVAPERPPPRHKHQNRRSMGENASAGSRCILGPPIDAAVQRAPKPMLGGHDDRFGQLQGVAEEFNHWQSRWPTGTIRQRSRSDEFRLCAAAFPHDRRHVSASVTATQLLTFPGRDRNEWRPNRLDIASRVDQKLQG
jgi:hypothetical protein